LLFKTEVLRKATITMEDITESRQLLAQLLAREVSIRELLHTQINTLCGDNPPLYEYIMTLQQMLRCLGQLDGISLLIQTDGSIPKSIDYISAEIKSLEEKLAQTDQTP
jgi:hypothetical protein